MSELTSVYIDRTGDWCRSGNNTGKFYLREEADKVIKELQADNRRLKRKMYKALANWAHEAKFVYDDEFCLWDKVEQNCLIKVEECK